ncbi:hypothetical protein [Geobacillus thermopakistaniensis]|uniref:hypothetical protein n=1 Tax=Geobacillus thermopakistaniensis (strain MAS1) TaxID=1408282 RepID=UPI000FFF5D1D|nr:hypothetical protein [Geobacillus sp. MAS1]
MCKKESFLCGNKVIIYIGQVMLIGTVAVVGAYGAWYLGKKVKSLTSKGSLPLTGPRKGSLTLRDEKGKVIQRRYYDSAGRAKKDMDYSDHGNPKHHPWGPHRHKWKWDEKKLKEGKQNQ